MKKKANYFFSPIGDLTKLLQIMRLIFILITVCSISVNASVFSQSKKVTLSMKNATIRNIFDELQKQAGFKFFYIDEQIDVNRKVDLVLNDKKIEDVLNTLFANDHVKYKIFENNLVVLTPGAVQQITVSGKVTDASNGDPLPGVSISVEGISKGTISDLNGNFSLDLPSSNSILVFSYVGYLSQKISYVGQSSIDVQLQPDVKKLDEVVVVGYGSQKKSDVTGALIRVNSEELNDHPVTNAFEALQGKAAGVDITSNERPGEVGKVLIRGSRSLTATSDPLYVIDGVPLMSSGSIETINPRDIESIDILKDASATAIYGSRGANGVVIITTKRGKDGKLSLEYSGTYTMDNIIDKAPMMNASEYITWRRWAAYNAGLTTVPGDQPTQTSDKSIFSSVDNTTMDNIMKGWASGTWDGSKVTSTDWTDFVTRTGITQEHTLSASGGTDKMKAYASLGYLNQEGTQIGQNYEKYNFNINVDLTPKKWFSMGGSINANWSNQDYGMSTLGASSSSGPNSIYAAAARLYAYSLPYDADGNMIILPGGDDAVYTIMDEWNKSNQQRQTFRALGSFYASVDFGKMLKPLKGLTYRFNFGPDYRNWREGVYIDKTSVNRLGGTSLARLRNQRDFSWTADNILSYNNRFGKHSVGVTLLQTASKWNIESSSMSGEKIPVSSFKWNNFSSIDVTAADTKASMSSGLTDRQLMSYMGRFNYAFNDRYLLTVSGRWDAASQLAEGHKWSFFPSAALGWRLDQEQFLKDKSWINQLKLRAGVGSTGNAAVNAYATKGPIQSFFVPFGGSANVQAYATNEPNYTKDATPMANINTGWEITTQYNLGVDFSFFDNRFSGTVDVYRSHTTDLLMDEKIPSLTGYFSTVANIGETRNKGIDISFSTVNVKSKDFKWTTDINAAWQKDEIVSLAYGKNDMIDNGWFIGQPISVYYDIKADGMWQESEAATMALYNAKKQNFQAGKVKPVDQNGDTIINASDRVILGNRAPRWTVGLTNTFAFKGVELSFMLYGRFDYMVQTGGESQLGRYNQRVIDYWTPTNTNADFQKPIYSQAGGDAYSGLLGYRDASFLKVRYISLGYNLPKSLISKIGAQSMKVYVQAKNPGSLYSAIDWMDMDLGTSTYNRGWVFGVNVGF